jgi:uncharacterized protein YuzE
LGGLAVRITYDRESDAATIYLLGDIGPGGAPRSVMCDLEVREGAVILLFGEDNRLVGIEVPGASKLLPRQLPEAAKPPEAPADHSNQDVCREDGNALGDRLTVGGAWLVPNVRGDVAALLDPTQSSVSDAYRCAPFIVWWLGAPNPRRVRW